MTTALDPTTPRVPLRRLLALPGFRRLLYSRFGSQFGTGLFQAGLAGAVLFNPERRADALAIAAGFATLLLPYSVIGPFAGALLDRWDRRRVLVAANLLCGVLSLVAAGGLMAGLPSAALFGVSLFALGVSRFIGSGLSASLPHVVPPANLVQANSVAVTAGALVAVLGGACATGLRLVFGENDLGSGTATSFAVFGSLAGALFAIRFARGALGPDEVDEPSAAVLAVARGLLDGARAAWHAPRVVAGFVALFAHRAAAGVALLMGVLLMRYAFTDQGLLKAGLPGLVQLAGMIAVGIFIAGLVTPRLVTRFGRRAVICGSLLLAAATMVALVLALEMITLLVAAFLLFGAGQVIKLCVDAVVQSDVGDEARGRVFALYDTLFNIVQVAAIALAATVIPPDGRSPGLIAATIVLYLVGVAGYLVAMRRERRPS